MYSGSVAQTNRPPWGRVHVASGGKCSASAASIVVAAAAVELAQLVDVVLPAALGEVGRDEQLAQRRRAEVDALLADVHLVAHRPRRDRPAEPDAGREDLRERAEVDDELAAVEREQRRQRLALVAQQPVRVVLEHEQLALVRDLDSRRRRGSDIVTPPGFWKVGTV